MDTILRTLSHELARKHSFLRCNGRYKYTYSCFVGVEHVAFQMRVEKLVDVHHGGQPLVALDFQPHSSVWDYERLATAGANVIKLWAIKDFSAGYVNESVQLPDGSGHNGEKRAKLMNEDSNPELLKDTSRSKVAVSPVQGFCEKDKVTCCNVPAAPPHQDIGASERKPGFRAICLWTSRDHDTEIHSLRWSFDGRVCIMTN